ncbi:MAG TPA: cytochrome c biogenesis protein CcdA [Chloroflexota bacterium]|nr:cytochrome c biogenesis protein CcdA [Chloroflexota bacterium]
MISARVPQERMGLAVSAAVLLGAGLAAIVTGPHLGQINGGVESVSSISGSALGRLANVLPFGYAFGAGMVAAVNPCGFALLPAYLALFVGAAGEAGASRGFFPRLGQAFLVSGVMTAGFVLVFGGAGLALGAASSMLTAFLPWIGLVVGVGLIGAGGRMVAGIGLYTNLGDRIADRLGSRSTEPGPRGYFAYGLAYAAASLSCALPIFLGVVAGALATGGAASATFQFVLYALGMGTVVTALTASIALVRFGIVNRARSLVRFVEPASGALLLLAGGYVVYYWLTLGGILQSWRPG